MWHTKASLAALKLMSDLTTEHSSDCILVLHFKYHLGVKKDNQRVCKHWLKLYNYNALNQAFSIYKWQWKMVSSFNNKVRRTHWVRIISFFDFHSTFFNTSLLIIKQIVKSILRFENNC